MKRKQIWGNKRSAFSVSDSLSMGTYWHSKSRPITCPTTLKTTPVFCWELGGLYKNILFSNTRVRACSIVTSHILADIPMPSICTSKAITVITPFKESWIKPYFSRLGTLHFVHRRSHRSSMYGHIWDINFSSMCRLCSEHWFGP